MTNQEISVYLNKITQEGFTNAMKEIDENDFPKTRRIKYYKATNNTTGKAYPPPLLIDRAYVNSVNKRLPDGFFDGIGKKSVHFKFLESNGFNVVLVEEIDNMEKKYLLKLSKKQDLRNEIYIPKKYIGESGKFFKDPRIEDPNPLGEEPHNVKVKMKWKGYDNDYKEYELKNFRNEFDANNDTRIAGTPKKDLNSLILFYKGDEGKYDVNIVNEGDVRYERLKDKLDGESYMLIDDIDNIKNMEGSDSKYPLNQILYGPPGTGKTYSTITKALDIIGVDYTDYKEAQELFQNELGKRIEFVTMHQSFSYEGFVQGLKPKKGDKGIEFDYKNGVFKEICRRADDTITGDSEIDFSTLSNKEVCMIAFFLSKYNGKRKGEKKANEFLGYKSDSFAFYGIGEKVGHKPNSIKNHRDKFDFMFKNRDGYTARSGWTPRNDDGVLDNTDKWPYKKVYDELNALEFEDLSAIVQKLLSKTKAIEVPTEINLNHVIILDEINRANISRVFGELIALIEEDKRDGKLTATLPSGEPFTVPSNLHIIGTMNTADKSIALVDIALRRRFKFVPMYPKSDILEEVLKEMDLSTDEINLRVHLLENLNRIIRSKKSVDFEIGHSYFMSNDALVNIMNDQILPLLNEYFMYDLRVVKDLLEKQQKDKDGNKIPRIGISLDPDEFKERGLLKVVSVTKVADTLDEDKDDENDSSEDDA